jgi:N-acetylmuramoyl-L-alanine amidase
MDKETFQNIRRYHIETKKWADIGYHAVIDMRGKIYAGRPESVQGAHVKESSGNVGSLAVCVIGHFDKELPTKEQWLSLVQVLERWCRQHGLVPSAETIVGHKDFKGVTKSCPGKNLHDQLPWVREQVRKRILGSRLEHLQKKALEYLKV